jgi:hypothetical protein
MFINQTQHLSLEQLLGGDLLTRNLFDFQLNAEILGVEGGVGGMFGSVPGNPDVKETIVQAVQLQQQSLCRWTAPNIERNTLRTEQMTTPFGP